MQTIVIDITARYRDETSSKINSSKRSLDKFNESIEKTKAQTDKAKNGFDRLMSSVKSFGYKTVSIPVKIIDQATKPLRSLMDYALSLKGVLTGLVVGVGFNKVFREPLALADQIESARIFFENKLGGTDAANSFLSEIYKFDEKSPFNTLQIIDTVKSMMGVGWTEKDVLKDIGIIGDAASSLGAGDEGVVGISRQLGQMRMKTRLSQEEINVLNERGIDAWKYIAEGMGLGATPDAIMKARELNEKGNGINGADAVKWVLSGMERDFGGASLLMADRTISGIMGQLESLLQTKVFLKWGEGIAVGTKKGLGIFKDLLEKNEDNITAFGLKLQELGEDISVTLVDKLERAYNKLNEMMDSDAFKDADIGGKFRIAWDTMIAEPLAEWWAGSGGEYVRAKAKEVGNKVGEGIAEGLKEALEKVLPGIAKDAGTLMPGGEKASSTALLSAAALAFGGGKLLKGGKALVSGGGALLGKLGLGATATATAGQTIGLNAGLFGAALGSKAAGAGLIALGGAGALGGALGLGGILSGGADIIKAAKAEDEAEKQQYGFRAGSKLGMVGTGAAAGAAIGSVVPVVGTGIGALIGAGVGGLGALFKGDSLGDWASGTWNKITGKNYKEQEEAKAVKNEQNNKIEVGGVHITLQGYGDADMIMNALETKMPELANQVAGEIATELERSYSNMPKTVEVKN